ncbi:MAG: MMPL family transporter [Chloroflexota bacterium]
MLRILAYLVYRFRYPVLVGWVLLLAVGALFAPQAPAILKPGGIEVASSPALRARDILVEKFDAPREVVIVVLTGPGGASDPQLKETADQLSNRLRTLPTVKSVSEPQTGRAGRSLYLMVNLDASLDQAMNLVPEVRAVLAASLPPDGRIQGYLTGGPAVYRAFTDVTEEDLRRAEFYTFPIAMVILLFVFGSVVASLMPLAVGLVAVTITLAALYGLGHLTDISVFALNTASMVGLGVAIDYSLLIVSRFREELAVHPLPEALARTIETAGEAILFSGLAVMIGLSGLLWVGFRFIQSIGLAGAIVVAVSIGAALTLLPALLGILGARINLLTLARPQATERLWGTLARRVVRWAVLVFILVTVLLLGLASPVRRMEVGVPGVENLPAHNPSRIGWELFRAEVPEQEASPLLVVVRTGSPWLTQEKLNRLFELTQKLAADPGVDQVQGLTTLVPGADPARLGQILALQTVRPDPQLSAAISRFYRDDVFVFRVVPKDPPSSQAARELAERLQALPVPNGWELLVGGQSAGERDFIARLYEDFPKAVGFVLALMYVVLLVTFRSAVLPLKAVIMNTLSILGAYGALVLIFQDGRLTSLLNYTSTGWVDAIVPVLMFCVLFGLSMDYEVFLLSRVREEYLQTGDNNGAVAAGLEKTGRIVTSAAFILIIVALSFSLGGLLTIKQMGVGLAIAIALDASIVRALLVPATMALLGHWNWWLPWIKRAKNYPEKP